MYQLNFLLSYLTSPITWIVFVFGAILGSFLNVCILRIPTKSFFKNTRSVCPKCEKPIPFYLNIPIISWLLLRGKANCCGTKISPQYIIVEILTALFFVVLYWKIPFIDTVNSNISFDDANLLRFIHQAVFLSLLIICSFIDLNLMIIPDVISIPMILLTPLVAYIHPDLTLTSAVTGAFLGGAILYIITWLYWLIKKEVGMGMGDLKLLAAIGGWQGHQSLLPTLFYGSIIGSIIGIIILLFSKNKSLQTAIPFGPFLAIGITLYIFAGQYIQELLIKVS